MQLQVAAHQPQDAWLLQSSQFHQSLHGSAEAQAEVYHAQSPQLPLAGPLQLPVWQLELELHQPQAAVLVHSSQSVVPAHSSVGQSKEYQFQSPQLPALGPPDVPLRHDVVSPHQPQPASTVHEPQLALASQGSGAVVSQALTYHTQSAQPPEVGPPLPPVAQVPLARHQPQVEIELQEAQSVLAAHGSAVPPHELAYQAQPEPQVPVVGPAMAPVMQLFDAPHQPQLAPAVHAAQSPAAAQGSVEPAVEHTSSVQVSPEQQSPVSVQMSEPGWQAQWPSTHDIQPQQSLLVAHVPPDSTQHCEVSGAPRQFSVAQHSVSDVQAAPTGLQAAAVRAHWLEALHSSPVRQRSPEVQQACPSPPQVTVSQRLSRQVPSQRLPHAPQLRGSRAVSTQAPLQQVAPAAVQLVPPQQLWPSSPQALGAVWHVPLVQTSPSLHAPPPQHGCRAAPQAGALSQTPDVHTSPEAQAVPEQHGWRSAPQAAVATHESRSQTSPDRHAPPAQHGCRSPPHAGSSMHVPPVHTSSAPQASPEQHGCPSRPQASAALQVPAEQVSPGPQAVPLQHGSRSCPHRSGGTSVGGRASSAPSRTSRGTSRTTVSSVDAEQAAITARPSSIAAQRTSPRFSTRSITASLPADSGPGDPGRVEF